MSRKKAIFEGWFSITTGRSSDVDELARAKFGPDGEEPEDREEWFKKRFISEDGTVTQKGWDALGQDARRLEMNAVGWLRKILESASDEGHGDNDELIGGFSFNARDPKQLEIVLLGVERGISSGGYCPVDPELDAYAWKGVSRFGTFLLDVDVYLNVDKDDLLKANALATWLETERERDR
jgi:hypothetical protein